MELVDLAAGDALEGVDAEFGDLEFDDGIDRWIGGDDFDARGQADFANGGGLELTKGLMPRVWMLGGCTLVEISLDEEEEVVGKAAPLGVGPGFEGLKGLKRQSDADGFVFLGLAGLHF